MKQQQIPNTNQINIIKLSPNLNQQTTIYMKKKSQSNLSLINCREKNKRLNPYQ